MSNYIQLEFSSTSTVKSNKLYTGGWSVKKMMTWCKDVSKLTGMESEFSDVDLNIFPDSKVPCAEADKSTSETVSTLKIIIYGDNMRKIMGQVDSVHIHIKVAQTLGIDLDDIKILAKRENDVNKYFDMSAPQFIEDYPGDKITF